MLDWVTLVVFLFFYFFGYTTQQAGWIPNQGSNLSLHHGDGSTDYYYFLTFYFALEYSQLTML